jgi:hypothetical protein
MQDEDWFFSLKETEEDAETIETRLGNQAFRRRIQEGRQLRSDALAEAGIDPEVFFNYVWLGL